MSNWWGHCATSQKAAVMIRAGVIGILHLYIPFDRTMTPGSIQLLTGKSTRNISWAGGGGGGLEGAGAWGGKPYTIPVRGASNSGSF